MFDAKDALKQYEKARTPGANKAIGIAIWALIAWVALVLIFGKSTPLPAAPEPRLAARAIGVSDESKTVLASLVNLSGQLCATVTNVAPLGGDVYRVDCIRYRDGTGIASYEINAATGAVK